MLAIMLLAVNGMSYVIFFTFELAALSTSDFAVSFGGSFVFGNFVFELFQIGRFFGCRLAGNHTLVNALLPVDLTLVNAGRCGWIFWGNRHCRSLGKGRSTNGQGQCGDQDLNLHDVAFKKVDEK